MSVFSKGSLKKILTYKNIIFEILSFLKKEIPKESTYYP